MPQEEFHLPASSLEELEKIIQGYAHLNQDVSLDSLEKLIGTSKSTISRNNGFLLDVEIITGTRKKSITDLGKKLGRALEHSQEKVVVNTWQEIIRSNEYLSNIISTVRIKGGMSIDDLESHVLYASGASKNKYTETGSRTIVDILISSNLLDESDGQVDISEGKEMPEIKEVPRKQEIKPEETPTISVSSKTDPTPSVVINIQLQLPETENVKIYDDLFKSLRNNLLGYKDNNNGE